LLYKPRDKLSTLQNNGIIEMNKSKKVMLSVAMIAAIGSMSALMPAVAKMDGERGQHRIERLVERLDLNEQQETEVKRLVTEHRNATQRPDKAAKAQKRQQYHTAFKAMLESPTFDRVAVQAQLDQHRAQRQARMINKLELKHAIYQVLTPEQRTSYLTMLEKQMKRKHHGGKKRGQHDGEH